MRDLVVEYEDWSRSQLLREIERLEIACAEEAARNAEAANWQTGMQVEIERLQEALDCCRELRRYDRAEIARLRAATTKAESK